MSVAKDNESARWWDDAEFQDQLVNLLVNDAATLRQCAGLLAPDDFKPTPAGAANARARWLVAERALEFWDKHKEPVGKLLRADVLEYCAGIGLGAARVSEYRDYMRLLDSVRTASPDALAEKVVRFKVNVLRKAAINELAELQSSNQLTDERWAEVTQGLVTTSGITNAETVNYMKTLEARIERRHMDSKARRTPWTLIAPLDTILHTTVGPGQVGLIMAPYKRGKSTMLLWLASALAWQRLNVLYVTLEDPRYVVEDRLDSIVTSIPLQALSGRPVTLRRKFERYRNSVHAQIEIYDGTGGGTTIKALERVVAQCRSRGFIPHALVVDYDEELQPGRKYAEKRFETDEIYRQFRVLCSNHHMIGWLAAQTKRDTRHLQILSGDKVAEDIGKARKVSCCISMGKGLWCENSIYLWVAAHKTAKMEVGCEIVPDLERALVYDDVATSRAARLNAATGGV